MQAQISTLVCILLVIFICLAGLEVELRHPATRLYNDGLLPTGVA